MAYIQVVMVFIIKTFLDTSILLYSWLWNCLFAGWVMCFVGMQKAWM